LDLEITILGLGILNNIIYSELSIINLDIKLNIINFIRMSSRRGTALDNYLIHNQKGNSNGRYQSQKFSP
jgi:hypothetical protein